MKQAASASLLRNLNRSAVLDLFLQNQVISRSQIARKLNMSLPTALRIIAELEDRNLVRPAGYSQETALGRPSALLEFNGGAYAVIGLDLGGTKMLGATMDLSGTTQAEISLPASPGGAQDNLELVYELIERLLASPRPVEQQILGIGIGAPGVTLVNQGIVTWAPSLGWRDLPLKSLIADRFKLPVYVDNDVNLAALGELRYGAGRGVKNLVAIAIGTGIGAGIILNGTLFRGTNQAAGEIGYLPPGIEFLNRHYDQFGALEILASGSGIAERGRRNLERTRRFYQGTDFNAEGVFNAARQGEAWALDTISETIDYLALAIAATACLLNPEVITIGGGVARSADLLIEPIVQRIQGVIPFVPRIVASPLGQRASLLGSIILVLNEVMDYAVVNSYGTS